MHGCMQKLEYHSAEMNFSGSGFFEFLENRLMQEQES